MYVIFFFADEFHINPTIYVSILCIIYKDKRVRQWESNNFQPGYTWLLIHVGEWCYSSLFVNQTTCHQSELFSFPRHPTPLPPSPQPVIATPSVCLRGCWYSLWQITADFVVLHQLCLSPAHQALSTQHSLLKSLWSVEGRYPLSSSGYTDIKEGCFLTGIQWNAAVRLDWGKKGHFVCSALICQSC